MTSTPGLAMEQPELTRAVVHGAVGSARTPQAWLIPGFSEVLKGLQGGIIGTDPVPEEAGGAHDNIGRAAVGTETALDGSVGNSSFAGASIRAGKAGLDADLDRAIAGRSAMQNYMMQRSDEHVSFSDAVRCLASMLEEI